ncbi:MAG: nucleotidyl transferase AbiEii/AbiGii toxin family protein [Caulobacteraceae bacterium]
MAAPSIQTLQRLAGETGLPAPTLEKVLRLLDLLQTIAADRHLATRVALKGGTALNVFHLGLDRLSVDIDLNYVGALPREAMEAGRPDIEAALTAILAAQGYQVNRQPGEHAGGKWVARFGSALGGGGVEVDLNFMAREPLFGVQALASRPLGGVVVTDVPVLDLHEVVGGKLVALVDRGAARDLFDTRRILEASGLDWALVRLAFLAWGAANRRDFRQASLDDIGGDPRELRQKLAICQPQNHFDQAGGVEAWIAESVALCRAGLAPLFERTAGEAAFLDQLLDDGVIDVSGLDAPEAVRARIARMPMLAWKAQNVRAHRAKGRREPAPIRLSSPRTKQYFAMRHETGMIASIALRRSQARPSPAALALAVAAIVAIAAVLLPEMARQVLLNTTPS